MIKKVVNNWLDTLSYENGGNLGDPEKPKYTAKSVPKNVNPNDLRPSMFVNDDEYLTYFGINNRYQCGTRGCAKFANDYVGKAIGLEGQSYSDWTRLGQKAGVGGHAWQNYGLITSAGGKSIYNKYTNQGNFSDLKPGDVIGLEHRNRTVYSGNYDIKGDNKPLAGVKNSHTGVVDHVKTNPDGSKTVYIKHNIGGTVHFEELKLNKNTGYYQAGPNWKLVTAARPNFSKFSPEFKYDEEKQEWTIDPYVSDYNPNNMVGLSTDKYDVYSDTESPTGVKESNPILRNQKINKERERYSKKPGTTEVDLFNDKMVEAMNSLNENKKKLMDYYKMSEDEFNSLAKQVIATAGVESQFGTSSKEKFKTNNPGIVTLAKGNVNDWVRSLGTRGKKRLDRFGENSLGIFQVKPYSVDPYFLDHFDLGNMKNFSKPEGNVLASFSHLYDDQKKAEKWLPKNSNLSQESLQDPTNVSYAIYNTPLTVKSGNLTPHPDDENKYANIRLRRFVEYKNNIPKVSNIETDTFIDPRYSNLPEYTVTPEYKQGGWLDTLEYQDGGPYSTVVTNPNIVSREASGPFVDRNNSTMSEADAAYKWLKLTTDIGGIVNYPVSVVGAVLDALEGQYVDAALGLIPVVGRGPVKNLYTKLINSGVPNNIAYPIKRVLQKTATPVTKSLNIYDAKRDIDDFQNNKKRQYGGTLTSPEQFRKDQITGDAVPIKSAIAYGSAFGNPSVKRMVAPVASPYIFKGDEPYTTPDMKGEYGTHYMFSEGNYAIPTIQQGLDGLFYNEQAGPMDREAIRFNNPTEANRFATRYKEFSPAFKYRDGGWLDNL